MGNCSCDDRLSGWWFALRGLVYCLFWVALIRGSYVCCCFEIRICCDYVSFGCEGLFAFRFPVVAFNLNGLIGLRLDDLNFGLVGTLTFHVSVRCGGWLVC